MRQVTLESEDRVGRYGYLRAQNFLGLIKRSKVLTYQQKQDIWKQAVHGDLEGAMRTYEKIMR